MLSGKILPVSGLISDSIKAVKGIFIPCAGGLLRNIQFFERARYFSIFP